MGQGVITSKWIIYNHSSYLLQNDGKKRIIMRWYADTYTTCFSPYFIFQIKPELWVCVSQLEHSAACRASVHTGCKWSPEDISHVSVTLHGLRTNHSACLQSPRNNFPHKHNREGVFTSSQAYTTPRRKSVRWRHPPPPQSFGRRITSIHDPEALLLMQRDELLFCYCAHLSHGAPRWHSPQALF